MDVVPLKVKIGLRPNGHADHPAWETLPLIAAGLGGGNPSLERIDQKINTYWLGSWHYDKTSGHAEQTAESPYGIQWGMIFTDRAFADEALATFPALVTQMTQAEAATFWDDKAMIRLADEQIDVEVLQGLVAHRQLLTRGPGGGVGPQLTALEARINRALDPDDPSLGVRRNPLGRFATARPLLGLTFHASVAP